jgi:hypothetical protein
LAEKLVKPMKSKSDHALARVRNGLTHDEILSIDPSDRESIDWLYRSAIPEGEAALMFAILENAINDYQKYFTVSSLKEKRQYHEAVAWILGKNNSDWLFSFDNICENVGLNPGYLRRRLRAWAEGKGCAPAPEKQDKVFSPKRLRRHSLR